MDDAGRRVPLDDHEQEELRKESYWARLDARDPPVDKAARVGTTPDGGTWVVLADAQDADFEAFHMRHSIGHSWDRYSSYGTIHGLRSPDGLPLATVLVSGGVVVHAREARNARLSSGNEALLAEFAAEMEWRVERDRLPFEMFDPTGRNTAVRILVRDAENGKTFREAVLPGSLDPDLAVSASQTVGSARFVPSRTSDPDAVSCGDPDAAHEIVAVFGTDDDATTTLGSGEFFESYAAGAGPSTPKP